MFHIFVAGLLFWLVYFRSSSYAESVSTTVVKKELSTIKFMKAMQLTVWLYTTVLRMRTPCLHLHGFNVTKGTNFIQL